MNAREGALARMDVDDQPVETEPDSAVIVRSWSDPEAFAEIFRRYAPQMKRYVLRRLGSDDAEDVVAETFVVAFRQRRGFDAARPSARPWLYGIAGNLLRRHARTEVRQKAVVQGLRAEAWPWPGESAPPPGQRVGIGPGAPEKLLDFDQRPEYLRSDYAYVRTLPTEQTAMRRNLYHRLSGADMDREAWQRVHGLLSSYLPPGQRSAPFQAVATIPGVDVVPRSKDARGRPGIAVARTEFGVREEYVLDPETYRFLGSRFVVTTTGTLQAGPAPRGSVIQAYTVLDVQVSDSAPPASGRRRS